MTAAAKRASLWRMIIAAFACALLFGVGGAIAGAVLGPFLAEIANKLGIATYDQAVPDSEVDLWLPFVVCCAAIGLVSGIIYGLHFATKPVKAEAH